MTHEDAEPFTLPDEIAQRAIDFEHKDEATQWMLIEEAYKAYIISLVIADGPHRTSNSDAQWSLDAFAAWMGRYNITPETLTDRQLLDAAILTGQGFSPLSAGLPWRSG